MKFLSFIVLPYSSNSLSEEEDISPSGETIGCIYLLSLKDLVAEKIPNEVWLNYESIFPISSQLPKICLNSKFNCLYINNSMFFAQRYIKSWNNRLHKIKTIHLLKLMNEYKDKFILDQNSGIELNLIKLALKSIYKHPFQLMLNFIFLKNNFLNPNLYKSFIKILYEKNFIRNWY